MLNYRTVALISHASKVMLKILQARLQQYVNRELPDIQSGFRKGRGTCFSNTWTVNFQMFNLVLEKAEEPEIKLPTSAGSSKKQESFRKNTYFCFTDYAKTFDCVDHNKLENS